MVAMDSGADNGFFYAGQVMHFSSPFTVFLIYHKHYMTLQYTELYNLINISGYLEVLFFLWYT